jgi:tetratricopeptide (TPR) repeat protein
MELDPSRWLVSLAGFAYDWIITREWKSILISMIPLGFLGVVASLVWTGSQLDRQKLSAWYLQLGENEIEDWESAWAPVAAEAASSDTVATSTFVPSAEPSEKKSEVSRFAEVLFRRAQLLQPSNQSQFVIGATLAQRGATEQAVNVLSKIAPNDNSGFAKAHAFLAMIYLEQLRTKPSRESQQLLKHHSTMSAGWDRTPDIVLAAGSEICWLEALSKSRDPRVPAAGIDRDTSFRLLALAAERNPNRFLEIAKRARVVDNKLVYDQAIAKAELHFERRLADNAKDDEARLLLAELYLIADPKGLERAEQLLRQREQFESDPRMMRALSEVYRIRFARSVKQEGQQITANIEMLDQAMRLDPTNPRITEEIAKLLKIGGVEVSDDLIDKLQKDLAEGKATTATHTLLSEAYLLRAASQEREENFKKALGHLEQVVNRQPNHSQCLNNMAYVIAELYPERLEESLEYARRAVLSAQRNPNADYYDTLGTISARLNRTSEAITAFELAIERDRKRVDFHERIAAQYRLNSNQEMATNHENIAAKLLEQQAAQQIDAPPIASESESPIPQSDSDPTKQEP